MKSLIIFEVRKIFNGKKVIYLCFFSITFIICLFVMTLYNTTSYNKDGLIRGVDAINSIHLSQEYFKGSIDNTDIQNCIEFNRTFLTNKNNFDSKGNIKFSNEDDVKTFNIYSKLNDLLIRVYSPLHSSDPNILNRLDIKDLKVRDILLNKVINIQSFYSNYKNSLAKDINKLDYGYSLGWENVVNDIFFLQTFILVVSMIMLHGIISDEYNANISSIIYTTINKTRINCIKLMVSIIAFTIIYFVLILFFTILYLSFFGDEGSNILILTNSRYWLSPFSFSYFHAYIFLVLVGYIALLTNIVINVYISKKAKRNYVSLIFCFLSILVPLFSSIGGFSLAFMPSGLILISENLLNIKWIGDINSFYLNVLICLVLFVIFSYSTCHDFKRICSMKRAKKLNKTSFSKRFRLHE